MKEKEINIKNRERDEGERDEGERDGEDEEEFVEQMKKNLKTNVS